VIEKSLGYRPASGARKESRGLTGLLMVGWVTVLAPGTFLLSIVASVVNQEQVATMPAICGEARIHS